MLFEGNNVNILNSILSIQTTYKLNCLIKNYIDLRNKYRLKIKNVINTRNILLTLPKNSNRIGQKNQIFTAIQTFNELPSDLKNLTCNKETLKKCIKKWLMT